MCLRFQFAGVDKRSWDTLCIKRGVDSFSSLRDKIVIVVGSGGGLPLLTIFTYFPVSLHFRAGERTPIEMTAGGRTCARVNSGGNTKGGTMAGTGHTGCARPSARSDGRIRSVTSKYSLFFPFAFFWVGQTATPARIRPHQPPYTVTTTYAAIPVPRAPQSARDTESERGLPPQLESPGVILILCMVPQSGDVASSPRPPSLHSTQKVGVSRVGDGGGGGRRGDNVTS